MKSRSAICWSVKPLADQAQNLALAPGQAKRIGQLAPEKSRA